MNPDLILNALLGDPIRTLVLAAGFVFVFRPLTRTRSVRPVRVRAKQGSR